MNFTLTAGHPHPQRTIPCAGRPQNLVARVVRLRIVLAPGRRQPLVVRPAQTQEQNCPRNPKHHDRPEDRSDPLQNVRGRFQLRNVVRILDRGQLREAPIVAVIARAALDVVRAGGVALLRPAAVHQVLVAVQRQLLVRRRAAPRDALVAKLVADARLPALDRVLAEVGVDVGAVGRLAAVAFVSVRGKKAVREKLDEEKTKTV